VSIALNNMKKNYSEILLSSLPDNSLFIDFADRIKNEFKAEIVDKINDLDTVYWDLKINSDLITLHQQTFIGITVFPKDLDNASRQVNDLVERIGFKLKYSDSVKSIWIKMPNGGEGEINYILDNILYARLDKNDYKYLPFKNQSKISDSHDHCDICWLTISNQENTEAWLSDRNTVCNDCFQRFIEKDDYLIELEKMDKINKNYR
jgi:3',5'-cyclic AMP phosphodiesterase CpdA